MRVNNWVSILVFLGALMYFVRVKGPQEHVRSRRTARCMLVTADGDADRGGASRGRRRADDADGPMTVRRRSGRRTSGRRSDCGVARDVASKK